METSEDFIKGETYTYSVLVAFEGEKPDNIQLYLPPLMSYTNVDGFEDLEEGKYGRVYVTRKAPRDDSVGRPHLNIRGGDGYVYFTEWKIEKGNKATDWTPAPEDQVSDWNETDINSFAFLKNKPTTFTPSAHTHGPITNDGKIGTLADRIIETTTGGLLTHVAKNTAYNKAFGTGADQVARGNHTHAYLPLSGGTLTGSTYNMLELKRSSAAGSSILFSNSTTSLGKIGFTSNGNLIIGTGASTDGVANMLSITPSGVTQFYGNISTSGLVTGIGFSKTGATDAHMLLGSGGHKAISDFVPKQ